MLTVPSVYQEFLARSLTDKYSNLSTHMDKIINEANAEIMGLRDKLNGLQAPYLANEVCALIVPSDAGRTERSGEEEPRSRRSIS